MRSKTNRAYKERSEDVKIKVEFDEKMQIYTIFNDIVPHFNGVGHTKEEAAENMLAESITFAEDYMENYKVFAAVFDWTQHALISNIYRKKADRSEIRRILGID